MLPLFHEYNVGHHRFPEHLRVAIVMAMVAPGCAFMFLHLLGWWNIWLWGCCGVGLSLALALYSIVLLHRKPPGISRWGERLVSSSLAWFPYYFVIIQSCIAALILLFLWFSISSMILDVPIYVHALLLVLAGMIPIRRYIQARMGSKDDVTYYALSESVRAVWHVLMTVFVARVVIGMTISDLKDTAPENLAWLTMIWVPALLYIVFTLIVTADHLFRRNKPAAVANVKSVQEEPMDRF